MRNDNPVNKYRLYSPSSSSLLTDPSQIMPSTEPSLAFALPNSLVPICNNDSSVSSKTQ